MHVHSKVVLLDFNYYEGGKFEDRLLRVHHDLADFAKNSKPKLHLHMNSLTRALLGYADSSHFPCGLL